MAEVMSRRRREGFLETEFAALLPCASSRISAGAVSMGKRLFVSSFARAAFAARLRSVMDERGVTLVEAAEGRASPRGKSFDGQP